MPEIMPHIAHICGMIERYAAWKLRNVALLGSILPKIVPQIICGVRNAAPLEML